MLNIWDKATLFALEDVRIALRYLLKFLEKKHQKIYFTHFSDDFEVREDGPRLEGPNDLQNYKKR